MKNLADFLQYLKNKRFIKRFESAPQNYSGDILLATTEYCNASVDIDLYKEKDKKLEKTV